MKIKLIQIGNSMGIRLPQTVIKECGFENELNLNIRENSVILTPISTQRRGWQPMIQDELSTHPIKTEGEWEW